jgi:hypothetical protein
MFFAIALLLFATPAMAEEPGSSLQLQATVERAKYCGSAGDEVVTLQLHLRLRYQNVGKEPIILLRGDSPIPAGVVGKRATDGEVGEKEFSWEANILSDGSEPPSSETWPNPSYVLLNAGQTFSAHGDTAVVFAPKRSDIAVIQGPGSHVLQFWAWTWPFVKPELEDRLRKGWQSKGYLWTKSVRSEPMQFTIAAHPKFHKCD